MAVYDVAPSHVAGLVAGILALPVAWLMLGELQLAARRSQRARQFTDAYRAASPMQRCAAALLLVTGAIHLGLVPAHLGAKGVTAVLFFVDGILLVLLSGAAFLTDWWRRAAVLLLLANLLAYVVWMIAGWEASDQVGVATKLVELVALGLVMRLRVGQRRTLPRRIWRAAALPTVVVFASAGIWLGGLAHPDATHSHVGALLQAVPRIASTEQRRAAQQLLGATRESISRYQDPAMAIAAGFKPGAVSDADPLVHFANPANAGVILDPQHPQDLVYAHTRHGLRLVGAMFQMPHIGQWGPDPGGPLTEWHQHEGICFTPFGFAFSLETPFWTCPIGAISVTTPPMLHVWIIDNPNGAFAADLAPAVQHQLLEE